MRVAHPSVWFQKSNKPTRPPDTDTDHLYPTNKGDPRPSTAASFRSLVLSSTSTPIHTRDSLSPHPFALMAHAPLPVVSSHDSSEDEEDCPVCLEPLSFSFRLPGEKPHIVPECGHALHEVCFSPFIALPSLSSSFVARARCSQAQVVLLSESRDLLFYAMLRSPSTTLNFSPSAPHLRARARSSSRKSPRFLPDSLIPLTILFACVVLVRH